MILNVELFHFPARSYNGNETDEALTFATYVENEAAIAEHEKKRANGEVSYSMALNKFADRSPTEFVENNLKGIQFKSPEEVKEFRDKLPSTSAF